MSREAQFPYASAAASMESVLDVLLPSKRLTVVEHAIQHRKLNNAGGGVVGPWSPALTPYVIEPSQMLTTRGISTVCVVGPGQLGKTVIAENWLLHSVDTSPAPMIWLMQSEDAVEAYVKRVINPLIDTHPELRDRQGIRATDDSLKFKVFEGMTVEFLSASPRSLINKSAGRIIADEVDNYALSLGDVKALLDVRRQTFGAASKLLMLSHPDLARGLNPATDWAAGIMAVYSDSTRCSWWWPCPHCSGWSSPVPIASRVMVLDYPAGAPLQEIEESARLICPVSGCAIEDKHRRAMNREGQWIGDGEEMDESGRVTGQRIKHSTAGYWLVGAMSPFILGGLGALARARVKAEREFEVSGDDASLRQVMVKQFGVPYAPPRPVGSVDAATLIERCEYDLRLGEIPHGVRFLTCAVDIQLAYFEFMVRGWGPAGESWIIDHGRVLADPATRAADWDALFFDVFSRVYPLGDGSRRMMGIRGAGYDSSGAPGATQQAYSAWVRGRRRRTASNDVRTHGGVTNYGRIAGREAWSVLPLKGAKALHAARLVVTYPDTGRLANKVASRGQVPIGMFNPNVFKDDLAGQLMRAEAGDWYVHFPAGLKSEAPPHTFFEQIVAETRRHDGRWEHIHRSTRNEVLDLMVMSHVLAHLHGLNRVNWDKPPSWAAPWDDNSMVIGAPAPALQAISPANVPASVAACSPTPASREVPAQPVGVQKPSTGNADATRPPGADRFSAILSKLAR